MVTATAIKKGYKQTELGVIPEDWDIKELGELVEVKDGTHQTPKYFSSGIPFYSVESVTNNDFTNTKYISEAEHKLLTKKFKIEEMDILMTRIGSIGDCKLITWCPNASFYVSLALLKPKNKLNSAYIYHFTRTKVFKKELEDRSLQWAIPKKINLGEIAKVKIFIPKDTAEQAAIAAVLSDADALIERLKRLIAKKKALKQGTMQQLLTGKKRLPGFSGKWKAIALGKAANIDKGQQINKSELTITGEYPDWNGGIVPSGYTSAWNTERDTITISEGGNSCGFVNYCKTRFWLGGHCYALTVLEPNLNKIFLYQLLKFKEAQIMAMRIGSGLPNIQKKSLAEFRLSIPLEEPEQTAIAATLSDMDAEIEDLEKKRDKYILLKQGMMQQLLTGKIRIYANK